MTTYPDMMYSVIITEGHELLYNLMLTPNPYKGEVVVKVHATAINLEDILYRNGHYSIPMDIPYIPGSDAVGEIVLISEDVADWAIGDRVVFSYEELGSERNGTHAEFVSVPVEYLGRIPEKMDYRTAATVTYALCRAWSGLIYKAKIRKKETIVIIRASTLIGLAALAIAKWKGATVIAIDSLSNASKLRDAGADMVLDENSDDLLTLVMTITEDTGVSLSVDMMGKPTISESIEYLAFDGRVLSLASYGGDIATINLQDLMAINGSIVTASDKLKTGDIEKLLEMVANSDLSPVVDSILPMSKADEAYTRIENDEAFGTILLIPDSLF